MKKILITFFLFASLASFGQADAGIEKGEKDGKPAWFAVSKHNRYVKIEYKLIQDRCNKEPQEYTRTVTVKKNKPVFLKYYRNGDCYGGQKLYYECKVLSKTFVK